MKYFYLLLFCSSVFSQSKPIGLRIDTLTAANDNDGRHYNLAFTISNNTDKTVHFILNPNNLIPIGGGSLNPSVYYKVFENQSEINVSGIFRGTRTTLYFKDEKEYQKYNDSIINAIKNKSKETLDKEKKERIANNIQELQPNEEKQYETILTWDKTRYFRNGVIEYYISETAKHYLELHVNLMQDELLSDFSNEEKTALLQNKNMVKGWYTSNKVEIDFGE